MDELAEFLSNARALVVLTGAGVSTESGIPDFRSPGGLWTKYDPRDMTFQRYVESAEVRALSWAMRREFFATNPQPNDAHRAIAELERAGRSVGVITQNIDGLHRQAGSTNVVEIHGTAARVMCIGHRPLYGEPQGCGWEAQTSWAFKLLEAGNDDPDCPHCGGLVKSATISFGQAMDPRSMHHAERMLNEADAMLVVGSSLQVYPVAAFPQEAVQAGMPLAIVNREPTPLDRLARVVVHDTAGPVLAAATKTVV